MKVLDKFPGKPRRAKRVRTPDAISPEQLQKGCLAFQQRERRDAMYKTATFLVKHFWGKPTEVAEGLGGLAMRLEPPLLPQRPLRLRPS
jgi:hypothetical protein